MTIITVNLFNVFNNMLRWDHTFHESEFPLAHTKFKLSFSNVFVFTPEIVYGPHRFMFVTTFHGEYI